MKVIFLSLSFSVLLLSANCAKKGPPTSPDRSPPTLQSIVVLDRNHIIMRFDERVLSQPAESLENFECSTLTILASVAEDNNIFITTSDMDTLDYQIKLLNIEDLSGNRQDECTTKFRGTLCQDTVPPLIVNPPPNNITNALSDLNLALKFSEPIDSLIIYILPWAPQSYKWNEQKTILSMQVASLDSITIYHIYSLFSDASGNFNKREFAITREKNMPAIWLRGLTDDSTLVLLVREGVPMQLTISDSAGVYIFNNIFPDNYSLYGKRSDKYLTTGPLDIKVPTDKLDLHYIQESGVDEGVLYPLDSIYNTFLSEQR